MENSENKSDLSAAEMSSLWTAYQSETIAICGISYFLVHIDDASIRQILDQALSLSIKRKDKMIQLFKEENYPIPIGFIEQDVNLNAPRLFSDRLYLDYILNMSILEMVQYGSSLKFALRSDMIDFFSNILRETKQLHIESKQLMKEKGWYISPPTIPKPNEINFVKKESFLEGWLGERRPLLGVEMAQLIFNSKRNALGQALITGFSQVAKSKEIRRFFERGRDISGKHVDVFSKILHDGYVSDATLLMTSEVTDSTEAPFSDKLMLVLVTSLITSGVGEYGMAMSMSPRRDLGIHYTRLTAELVQYLSDGADMIINNGWMEQPPITANRKDLAK